MPQCKLQATVFTERLPACAARCTKDEEGPQSGRLTRFAGGGADSKPNNWVRRDNAVIAPRLEKTTGIPMVPTALDQDPCRQIS